MDFKGISNGSLREQYLQQTELIKQEIGDLEQIRLSLGLSQRRMCLLLMVDPSAWTRWLKTEAPPHIYQALKWMVELKKINPEITGPVDMLNRVDLLQSNTDLKLKKMEDNVAQLERILVSSISPGPRSYETQLQQEISNLKARIEEILNRQQLSTKKKVTRKVRASALVRKSKKQTIPRSSKRKKLRKARKKNKRHIARPTKKKRRPKSKRSSRR